MYLYTAIISQGNCVSWQKKWNGDILRIKHSSDEKETLEQQFYFE